MWFLLTFVWNFEIPHEFRNELTVLQQHRECLSTSSNSHSSSATHWNIWLNVKSTQNFLLYECTAISLRYQRFGTENTQEEWTFAWLSIDFLIFRFVTVLKLSHLVLMIEKVLRLSWALLQKWWNFCFQETR